MNHPIKNLPNLLIVDDAEENLVFIENIIKKIKINLIQALSGFEALKKTEGIDLALAIIDVRMPEMNGYELALKLNSERSGRKVPIIFLTANQVNEIQIFKGYNSGAVDYIFKPIDIHILLCKINIFVDLFYQKQTIISAAVKQKITAEKLSRVVDSLKKSEEKYRSYIDYAPDGVFVTDETGKYIEVNKAACRITGYSKNELLNMSITDILPKESLKNGFAYFRKLVKTGVSKADLLFKHKNGTIRWWTVEAVNLDNKRFLGFTKDITDRKSAEKMLRENEDQFRAITQSANDAIITADCTGMILGWNKGAEKIFGYSEEEISGKNLAIIIPQPFAKYHNKNIERIVKGGSFVIIGKTVELLGLHKHGNEFPIEISLASWETTSGMFFTGIIRDITERKMAEQALKVSEEKYKTMLNASPDGILLINLKGIITEVSEIGLELFGADTRDDLVGKHFFRFIPSDEKNTVREIIDKTMNEGLAQNNGLKIRKKNQSFFAGETSATLIQDPNGAPLSYMIIIRDISQRKKMETKQMHADRMANLGEMASGIAHEINQPLNIISMVMDKILFESAKTEAIDIEFLKNKSNKIFENITRIRNIIDHIRSFSRSHDDYLLTAFDINYSIENAVSMILEQFKYLGINLNLQLEKQIPQLFGNTYKFEQVIVNLLVNAKDAVVDKKNKQEENTEMIVGIKSYQENQFLIVEVTDNGIGITNDDINNIILPFYTTKDEGKGTGLGLSICYQIIKEMNGIIEITSDKLNGTKIKIVLDSQKQK
ncbi:MAG: PAS domain S-box protein [Bacteroidales bacterium]|nr:PAS domain S-box protein [Bacteroidales bacterium]